MPFSIFRRILPKSVPKPVTNTGSQLRDHQANERPFLSWIRMGLAFAAISHPLGIIDDVFNPDSGATSRPFRNSSSLRLPRLQNSQFGSMEEANPSRRTRTVSLPAGYVKLSMSGHFIRHLPVYFCAEEFDARILCAGHLGACDDDMLLSWGV